MLRSILVFAARAHICASTRTRRTPTWRSPPARGARAFWDKLLNQSYQMLRETLDGDRADELRGPQREWLKFRDAVRLGVSCLRGGGTFARVVGNQCFSRETARRAIDLTNSIR